MQKCVKAWGRNFCSIYRHRHSVTVSVLLRYSTRECHADLRLNFSPSFRVMLRQRYDFARYFHLPRHFQHERVINITAD